MRRETIPPQALESFHRTFFFWVEREWNAEIRRNYPLLSLPVSVEAAAAVTVLRSMSSKSSREAARGLNKLRPVGPTTAVGDLVGKPTSTEAGEAQRFRDQTWAQLSRLQLTGDRGAWALRRLDRIKLRELVRSSLQEVAGEVEEYGGRYEWRHWKAAGPWRVSTHIDLSDAEQQLIYHHGVWLNDVPLIDGISLMSWLGIMGMTRWNSAASGSEPRVAADVTALCDHFLKAIPGLLDSL